jgi:hypothetical protein
MDTLILIGFSLFCGLTYFLVIGCQKLQGK